MRALAAAAACAGALAIGAAPADGSSCGVEIEWRGDAYLGVAKPPTGRGRRLGTGVVPGCDGPDERVVVHAVRGVAARFAIASSDEPGLLFVNSAYPVRLPQHPLHARFYGHRRWPTCRPTRHVTVAGELESLVDVLRLGAGRGTTAFFVDDRTRMAPRFGRLEPGDRIRVEAAECRFAGGPSVPFARRLTVLERGSRERERDPNVALAAAITAAIFALAFTVRAARRRRPGRSTA